MREYCKCSVYDRMSTRPFLTVLEKKWITFQVLYALHRMHKLGICHGDIKVSLRLYNTLFSFSNLVILSFQICMFVTYFFVKCFCYPTSFAGGDHLPSTKSSRKGIMIYVYSSVKFYTIKWTYGRAFLGQSFRRWGWPLRCDGQ